MPSVASVPQTANRQLLWVCTEPETSSSISDMGMGSVLACWRGKGSCPTAIPDKLGGACPSMMVHMMLV